MLGVANLVAARWRWCLRYGRGHHGVSRRRIFHTRRYDTIAICYHCHSCLSKFYLGYRLFSLFKLGLKAILRAVRLIGYHHNIAPCGQHRINVFVFPRHKLLNGGKHDAA